MKWLLGGFVLWITLRGRLADYYALVAQSSTTDPSTGNSKIDQKLK